MEKLDVVVIGAGVIGLAIAREAALQGRDVVILEAETVIGSKISSRNSEVIHAGIYYPTGSLRARFCVRGKEMLYAYCTAKGVPHKRLGKIVVASNDGEKTKLQAIWEQAKANGVNDLSWLDKTALSARQPEVKGIAGLVCPSTGIIDAHQLMESLLADAKRKGATLALSNRVCSIESQGDGLILEISTSSGETYAVGARAVINSAGLGAWEVAGAIKGINKAAIPPKFMAKGVYFKLSGCSPFNELIYPIPPAGCLGIHLTIDMGGNVRFGPNIEWVDAEEYGVDENDEQTFRDAIAHYYPGIADKRLNPDYAGIRPKITGPGAPQADFMIQGARDHGVKGLINLFGIESPGLTSCLAIAGHVVQMT
jgi:L-2-hydroxyglutarate oxidase LhgO